MNERKNDNTNRDAVLAAIWNNPERAFNCRFRQSGIYWENADSNGEYDERGKIRLRLINGGPNIHVSYNGSSRPEKSDVITYLTEYVYHCTFNELMLKMAELYGLSLNISPEARQALNRATLAREVAATLVEALRMNPDGETAQYIRNVRGMEPDGHFGELSAQSIQAAKDHLKARGKSYDYDDLKALGLTDYNVKNGYTVAIPITQNGRCVGFTFRNTNKDVQPRYRCSEGLGRPWYCGQLTMEQPAVLVEGQFDAIRLIQAGVQNVIATGGATMCDDLAKLLKGRRISEITYVPDIEFDAEGKQKTKIITEAIKAIQAAKVDGEPVVKSLFVALLPTPEGVSLNGYKIDADEYGKLHGADNLREAVRTNAANWWAWEIENLLSRAMDVEARDGDINVNWFRGEFAKIYNRCGIGFDRQAVRNYIKGHSLKAVFDENAITEQALLDIDVWTKGEDYTNKVKAATADLAKAVEDGANPVKVAEIVARLTEAQATNTRSEWERQLGETFDDELDAIRRQPEALRTKWELGKTVPTDETKTEYKFIRSGFIEFYPADIAVVCAVSSHGKTTFMVQAALDMVRANPDKTFLYVSCEENKRQLTERVINSYLPIENTPDGKTKDGKYCFIEQTRRRTVKAVICDSPAPSEYEGLMGVSEHYNTLSAEIRRGLEAYAQNIRPRLKLIHTDASAESICGNIRYYMEKMAEDGVKVGGVFVDYMQLLGTENKNYSRHDELKNICKALKECAAKTEIPFIIAAQLNREGIKDGIDAITIANLAEGADIERIAHDIYFVWQNSKTKKDVYFTSTEDKKTGTVTRSWNWKTSGDRANRIFTHNELRPSERELKEGYLYVECLKARDGQTGGWGLLEWDGESGHVGTNDITAMLR